MYALDEIAESLDSFRQAVENRSAFRPLYVKIKLIYGCNLKCEMCNHWREPRETPLSMDRFSEILGELAEMGCRKVHFSGGEPLLRPGMPEMIGLTKELGMRATMTTNGTLVDKLLAKRLIRAGLRGVNISIDSPTRKIHDRIRGIEGAWKGASRAVRYFRKYVHKGKLTIRINTVVSRSNYRSLVGLPDYVHELGAGALNLISVDAHCGEHLALSRGNIHDFNTNIAPKIANRALALGLFQNEKQAYPFGRTDRQIKRGRRGEYAFGWYESHPCFAPWTHSLIDYNGQVYVCCMTRERIEPLGDLKVNTFSEIWMGQKYGRIRESMFPPALPSCQKCDDFLDENHRLYGMLNGKAG